MDIPASDGAQRHIRRYRLAWRLMAHQVRVGMISAMTSFSCHQLSTLRRRWGIAANRHLRGRSPISLSRYVRPPHARSEGAVLAAFCRIYGVTLPRHLVNAPRKSQLTLELGERLCPTYEAFCACFPECTLDFERVVNLIVALAKDELIGLEPCESCGATVLIDRLAGRKPVCESCEQERRRQRALSRPSPRRRGRGAAARR